MVPARLTPTPERGSKTRPASIEVPLIRRGSGFDHAPAKPETCRLDVGAEWSETEEIPVARKSALEMARGDRPTWDSVKPDPRSVFEIFDASSTDDVGRISFAPFTPPPPRTASSEASSREAQTVVIKASSLQRIRPVDVLKLAIAMVTLAATIVGASLLVDFLKHH
jgi:hypothetical protein